MHTLEEAISDWGQSHRTGSEFEVWVEKYAIFITEPPQQDTTLVYKLVDYKPVFKCDAVNGTLQTTLVLLIVNDRFYINMFMECCNI